MKMNAAQMINQTSGKTDYHTPPNIIEAARTVMGGIDLDPASSAIANQAVRATHYYSEHGLVQTWSGRVWMNHPFSRAENAWWIDKLIMAFDAGDVTQACCITFACTSERWFRPLLNYPQCYLSPRTNYRDPQGNLVKGVTKGSVVTYLGSNVNGFVAAFQRLGSVMLPAAFVRTGKPFVRFPRFGGDEAAEAGMVSA